jgi:hypothetical protein
LSRINANMATYNKIVNFNYCPCFYNQYVDSWIWFPIYSAWSDQLTTAFILAWNSSKNTACLRGVFTAFWGSKANMPRKVRRPNEYIGNHIHGQHPALILLSYSLSARKKPISIDINIWIPAYLQLRIYFHFVLSSEIIYLYIILLGFDRLW